MKYFFEQPKISVSLFNVADIITASSGMEGYGPDTDDHYEFGERT